MDIVGFTAVFMGIGIGMLAIWLDFRRKKLVHEERMEALRQGITPPDWLTDIDRKQKTPRQRAGRFFTAGLISFFIGLACFLGCTFMGLPLWIGFWASFPGWIGLALVVVGILILKGIIDDDTSD
ncbi:MAG: hypothetical protein A2Y64_07745 [Candidatus Coatesbacteria bacterium RBG_13_66_14]|uniref:Uncharacterized protein n=1 Tax=Candidatus Coatesbacteria bacterium RBG_13_66_14 TaxID=1817816 RepID=A0A1F5FAZ2_9BACT|nr:MAG: hypothetical protein A2Y64_07745 [Candidatus Coatesbacteria bacterium RBG_13_66_14]